MTADPVATPPSVTATPVPPGFGLVLDPGVRRIDDGRVLVGGSPLRLLRLRPAGAAAIDAWTAGEPVGPTANRARLARRLLDAGLAHPRPPRAPVAAGSVTVVVPVFGGPADLEPTLRALHEPGADPAVAEVVVVDDASPDPAALAVVAERWGARFVTRPVNGGPGAARNTGLALVVTPVIAFLDADVEPEPGWLEPLLAHLADPAVAAVAPRVRPTPGAGVLDRFDREQSPLDLGPDEARVVPGSRVAYVPSTALVARTDALRAAAGFDETLRTGEDVDLVWRLTAAGATVRYEPAATVRHPARADLGAWVRQRVAYGTSAAALDARHPGSVAPLAVSGWTAAAWGLAVAGQPLGGAAVAAVTTALLPRRLGPLDHPWAEAARLAGRGHLGAWRPLAGAATRAWWPVTLGAAVVSRRARRAAVLAAVVPPAIDWWQGDRAVDPVRYLGLRVLDDVAYGSGVWLGCLRQRRAGPLRPTLTSWPGRGRAGR